MVSEDKYKLRIYPKIEGKRSQILVGWDARILGMNYGHIYMACDLAADWRCKDCDL